MNESSSQYIDRTSKDYSIYVNTSRAIAFPGDGLKTGQRIAMWVIRNKAKEIKTISLAGEMISQELYLHGDAAAADSISNLAAPFKNNLPLLTGIGGFGSRADPDNFSAPRYTYVKKNKATDKLLYLDQDIVPLKENHDGSNMEPIHFLPPLPLVLLNGVSGMGVGYSTDIFPRSLKDLICSVEQAIDGKKITTIKPAHTYLNSRVEHIEGNSYYFIGRVEIIDTSTIKVTELPPDINLIKFKETLEGMLETDKINDYEDNTGDSIDVTVKLKRGSATNWSEDDALNFLKLKTRNTELLVVQDWSGKGIRKYESAEQLVVDFVEWRFSFYVKRYEKLFEDSNYDLQFWKGVCECYKQKLPEKIQSKKDKSDLVREIKTITTQFNLDDDQIDKIASWASYRWAKDGYQSAKDKVKELEQAIKYYKVLLNNPDKIRGIFKEEVTALKSEKF